MLYSVITLYIISKITDNKSEKNNEILTIYSTEQNFYQNSTLNALFKVIINFDKKQNHCFVCYILIY